MRKALHDRPYGPPKNPPTRETPLPPGTSSNAIIVARNGGVRHQFLDDVGGCSANYR